MSRSQTFFFLRIPLENSPSGLYTLHFLVYPRPRRIFTRLAFFAVSRLNRIPTFGRAPIRPDLVARSLSVCHTPAIINASPAATQLSCTGGSNNGFASTARGKGGQFI